MKHNVFLGSGSGSIGDVVSYRREGTQVSRMRVREIKNPRTYNQAEQRNFLAPVSKFYAPLAGALEQSWEGKSTAKSYAALSSAAVKKARLNGWYLPKGTGFFPLPYQLTQGTIAPLDSLMGDGEFNTTMPVKATAAMVGDTWGAFSKWMIACGYQDGDQLTFINVTRGDNGSYFPSYNRVYLDSTSAEKFDAVTGYTLTPIVENDNYFSIEPKAHCWAMAIIVSRYENEKWRRSTQTLQVVAEAIELVTGETAKANAIASYMDGEYVPVSEIYLNGSTQP